jgi:hypothetical protein
MALSAMPGAIFTQGQRSRFMPKLANGLALEQLFFTTPVCCPSVDPNLELP